jgi:hypothetical protein
VAGAFLRAAFLPAAFLTSAATEVGITLNGTPANVRVSGLVIRDILNDAPNTCSLKVDGTAPQVDQALRVTLNEGARVLFAGTLQTVDQSYEGKPNQLAWMCNAIDDTARANYRRPFGTWVSVSASTIADSLVADFAPSLSDAGIEAGLPAVTITFDGSATFIACFARLAEAIGGYCKVEDGVVYLFLTDTSDPPDDIDSTPGRFLHDPPIAASVDVSQLRTRIYGKGYGENVPTDVLAADTIVPLQDGTQFNPSGGQAITGTTPDGAQSQVIDYTGVDLGGEGTLVGPGAQPASAPVVSLAAGSGIESGVHGYAQVWVTAAGKSLPSPIASIDVGFVAAPLAAVIAGTPTAGGSMDAGSHRYYPVFRTAAGSTTAGPVSNAVTALAEQASPSVGGFTVSDKLGGSLDVGGAYRWKYSYVRNSDGAETLASPASNSFTFSNVGQLTGLINITSHGIAAPAGYTLAWYRTDGGGSTYKNVTSFSYGDPFGSGSTFFIDGSADGTLGAVEPVANTTKRATCPVTGIPVSPDSLVTHVDMYREFNAAGAGTAKLAFSVANGTTTGSDTVANSGLGATVPGSNTAAANQVTYARIAGPTGTTSREYYRTVAAGSQLKLLATLGDNSTVTNGTDSTADGSLGANVHTSDTSGLTQPQGQVNAGSTSLITASAGPFASGGGWVSLAGGQTVRYTGITLNTLTGIPASGPGSILTTVLYGSQAIPTPSLTGVTGLTLAMAKGSAVHIWVQRDDVTAQAAQAARAGSGDGVVEFTIFDGRRGEASLIALCDANLALFAYPLVTVRYATRDVKTKSGKTVHVALSSPTINEDLTIQEVTIDQIDIAPGLSPRFTVTASNVRFSLEDTLRRLVTG